MESIKLTDEQKDKLLEMCDKLFNKNVIIFWSKPDNMLFNQDLQIKIHWFEFVYSFLGEKIVGYTYNLIRALDEENSEEHPVNYLYEQFKKLE